jgi:hypothetical protein
VTRGKIIAITAGALLFGASLGKWELANWPILSSKTRSQTSHPSTAFASGWRLQSPTMICEAVIEKARAHDISVDPAHITIKRSGTPETPQVFLAVDYRNRVGLPLFGLTFHFHTTSGKR